MTVADPSQPGGADAPAPAPEWPHVFRPGTPPEGSGVGPVGATGALAPVYLLLHGTGGSEHDLLGLADELAPGGTLLSPRGPVVERNARRWFARRAEGVFDVDDVVRRAGELAAFLAAARIRYSLQDRRIIAIGFSNGANIALATALLHPDALAHVVAFSGMFPLDSRPLTTNLAGSEILLLNGQSDPMAPLESANLVAATLEERGAQVTRHLRAGGHGIAAEDLAAAREWLAVVSGS